MSLELHELCVGLSQIAVPFLEMRGSMGRWRSLVACAADAADRSTDLRLEALAALLRSRLDEYWCTEEGAEHAGRAVELFRLLGDDLGAAYALNALCYMQGSQGHLTEAQRSAEHALALVQHLDSVFVTARSLHHLTVIHREYGRLDESARFGGRALLLWRRSGNERELAVSLHSLGRTHLLRGYPRRAALLATVGVSICRRLGDSAGEVVLLSLQAEASLATGRDAEAEQIARRALDRAEASEDQDNGRLALNVLAMVHLRLGRPAEAEQLLRRALPLWRRLGPVRNLAATLLTMGDLCAARGDRGGARAAWNEAAALLRARQHPDARLAETRLAGLSHTGADA